MSKRFGHECPNSILRAHRKISRRKVSLGKIFILSTSDIRPNFFCLFVGKRLDLLVKTLICMSIWTFPGNFFSLKEKYFYFIILAIFCGRVVKSAVYVSTETFLGKYLSWKIMSFHLIGYKPKALRANSPKFLTGWLKLQPSCTEQHFKETQLRRLLNFLSFSDLEKKLFQFFSKLFPWFCQNRTLHLQKKNLKNIRFLQKISTFCFIVLFWTTKNRLLSYFVCRNVKSAF